MKNVNSFRNGSSLDDFLRLVVGRWFLVLGHQKERVWLRVQLRKGWNYERT
jgi:hypothetical protein